jgi:putative peptide zinc metalloprotease protein
MVDEVLVVPGQPVTLGEPLVRSSDVELETRARVVGARVQELEARRRIARSSGRTTEAQLISEEIGLSNTELAQLREELDALLIRSPAEGVFHLARSDALQGRFLRRGAALGYVLQPGTYMARVVVDQADVDAVRSDVQALEVRLAEALDQTFTGEMVGEVPTDHRDLPSLALSVEGGGRHALDPGIRDRPTAFEPFFQFEIRLEGIPANRVGERIYALFVHTPEPIGFRWWRSARRVLLERLSL